MKVAITGVSGYLGKLLVRALDRDSSVDSILGFDLVEPDLASRKFSFHVADVRYSDFRRLLQGTDAVFHLAFVVAPPRGISMTTIDQINVEGSKRLFQGAIAAGVPRIIYASSIAVYGAHPDHPGRLTEDTPLRPNQDWYYSRTKGRVESLLDALEHQHPGTIIMRFRPGVVIGPSSRGRLRDHLGFPWLLDFNRRLRIDLCWDEDVVEAFRLALQYEKSGVFNLSGGSPLSIAEMGRMVGKRVIPVRLDWILPPLRILGWAGVFPRGLAESLDVALRYSIIVSSEKARKQLGWNPRFDSSAALVEYAKRLGLIDPGKNT